MVELGIALVALTVMEIVLGIDNIVFISIQTAKLPKEQRAKARWFGLGAAMGTRILLLFCINWIMQLTQAIFLWSELLDWLGDGTIGALGLEKAKAWLLDEHHLVTDRGARTVPGIHRIHRTDGPDTLAGARTLVPSWSGRRHARCRAASRPPTLEAS